MAEIFEDGVPMIRSIAVFLALTLPAGAFAQALQVQAPPVGFSGALLKYSNDSVTLKDKDGKEVALAMTPGWTVSRPRTVPAVTIKAGDFIASANRPVNDHTGTSTEVRIMEPGYRPEFGTHLMAGADSAMTHGTVTRASRSAAGVELDVTYPDGSRHLLIPDDVKVTNFDLLERRALKPGLQVGAVARRGDDGVLRAGRLTLPAASEN
jgi:hypothetical protein